MSKQKRRGFTEEFKRDAVRLVTDEGYSLAEDGRSLGVRGDMIARWKRRFEAGDEATDRDRQISDMERIRELEAENRRLRMEKDILKKATAFFVQEKP